MKKHETRNTNHETRIKVTCAAKVNLFLDILGRRLDGYHEIVTVMQTVSVTDEMLFEAGGTGFEVSVEGGDLPTDASNLIWKAAERLAERAKVPMRGRVMLKKRIPVAAGLGGGSADAAAALVALNRLWGTSADRNVLHELAKQLGADVPFFLRGGCAVAHGIGEQLVPLKAKGRLWFLLAKPPLQISTAWAYRRWDELHQSSVVSRQSSVVSRQSSVMQLAKALEAGDLQTIARLMHNALEAVVASEFPEVMALKRKIKASGALGALMSGSGPTVFGLFADKQSARKARRLIEGDCEWCCVAHSVSRSIALKSEI